ncbi:hypothetical protein HRI_003189700 [Hibiscus trionum]|uniref:Uncharacterized protein n=1 Tax=Hibiscus trionum TaxID=183268 RepID=A0A9W7IE55_HIBTR|nr:hypothetical protein HRI_003189700 [Hibiscus trionum]
MQTMTTFMPPPPPATFLAFHPQDNNIIAIGMDDSSIQIYNVRVDEVKTKLKRSSEKNNRSCLLSYTERACIFWSRQSALCMEHRWMGEAN